jgi:hypothetical protein
LAAVEKNTVIDPATFKNLQLHGGFVIREIEFVRGAIVDALGREASAQTRLTGREFQLLIRHDLSEEELSVTLYHEILEAATVASLTPPSTVMEFNESDFERAAKAAHARWGAASVENLNRMLHFYGFQGE